MTRTLVTGVAGFIGSHVARRLSDAGTEVVGVDNFSPFTERRLQEDRIADLRPRNNFRFVELDLADRAATAAFFEDERPSRIIHLAGQASVRYARENPYAYGESNLVGFLNLLEGARHTAPENVLYASSSSVYGGNVKVPFGVDDPVDHPLSLYAATKKANELMAHAYAESYGIPLTGLRFFTVYGPWGRPDMAVWMFTRKIFAGEPIELFNHGDLRRDFTYVDDIVDGILRLLERPAASTPGFDHASPTPSRSRAPYRVYNIGNNSPVELMHMVAVLERLIGRTAIRKMVDRPPGEMLATYADIDDLTADTGFQPQTSIEEGLARFVTWYRGYRGL